MKRAVHCGVYKILCISTGKVYIGSSSDIFSRISDHKSRLRGNRHANSYLQNSWNLYGENGFEFSIIEIVNNQDILHEREQYWINFLKSYDRLIGFNLSEKVDQVDYDNHFNSRMWIITTPNGEEIIVKNLQKYCRDNNLSRAGLGQVARGICNHSYGYKCRPFNMSKEQWSKSLTRPDKHGHGWKGSYKIITPNGSIVIAKSLTKFCKENNLSQGNMNEVAKGKRKQHKGFKCEYLNNIISPQG